MGCGNSKVSVGAEALSTKQADPVPAKPQPGSAAAVVKQEQQTMTQFQPAEVFDAPAKGSAKDSPPPSKDGHRIVWVPDGTGRWVYVSEAGDQAVFIESASGLKNTDVAGKSDPYIVIRLGPAGSAWADKIQNAFGERRSSVEAGTLNPFWHCAIQLGAPPAGSAGWAGAGWELQCRVFDKDFVSSDDMLGEVHISLADLAAHPDTLREYALGGGAGVLKVMLGDRVAAALAAEAEAALASSAAGWYDRMLAAAGHLGQWVEEKIVGPAYFATMASFGLACAKALTIDAAKAPNYVTDGVTAWFRKRTDSNGADMGEWGGPILEGCTTFTRHAAVVARLRALGAGLGVSNGDGELTRDNWLGMQRLNARPWPEVPWRGIGLAMDTENHAWVRPLIVQLCGPGGHWSSEWLEDEASRFFAGRRSIEVVADLKVWVARVLHQVFLGYSLSEAEGAELLGFQWHWMKCMALPDATHDSTVLKSLLDLDGFLVAKEKLIKKYEPYVLARVPQMAARPAADLTLLTSAVLDALMFAGGQSIPTVLAFAIALPYSNIAGCLPAGFSLDQVDKTPQYVLEVMRRFAPVTGFPYVERSAGGSARRTVMLALHAAQMDDEAWAGTGGPASAFVLRPLEAYARLGVGFAEPAVAPRLGSPNSHACPAKDLGIAMCVAFVRGLVRSAALVDDSLYDGGSKVAALWKLELPPNAGALEMSMYGPKPFTLLRDDRVAGTPPADKSGEEMLALLAPEERAVATEEARAHNLFDQCNENTRFFIKVVGLMVKPGAVRTSAEVSGELQPKQDYRGESSWLAPLGGLRMIKEDEDRGAPGRVSGLFKLLIFGTSKNWSFDEDLEELLWFDSPVQAVAMMDATFGRYLPTQFNSWDGLQTDAVMAQLCIYGAAAWYLRGVKSAEAAGHAVPDGANLELDLEFMAEYATRSHWINYGHTAYVHCVVMADGGLSEPKLLGIWSCHHGVLVLPGDKRWEHMKAAFRSSVGCNLTCKDHLGRLHWVIANGLQMASRESLGPVHPLRRLLKPHYYGTAEINFSSKDMLLPVHQFAHRTFGFTDDGWLAYFGDILASWSWTPQPEAMAARALPPGFLEAWPLSRDGLAVWHAIEKYVRTLLGAFYSSEAELVADDEVRAFYAHFETQFDTPWTLPPLSQDGLVRLVADLIWWVTAGHELVGSIVEYLTSPFGLAGKLVDGQVMPDVQTFGQALVIIALTGIRQPSLINDWTHVFIVPSWEAAKQQAVLDAVRQFQADLTACAEEIDELNEQRVARPGGKKFVAFNPRIFETSVSI